MVAQVGIYERLFRELATASSPEDILAIQTTPEEDARLSELIERSKNDTLTEDDRFEINHFRMAEKYIALAKVHAHARLKGVVL